MRYRKTPSNERETYKLYDDFGNIVCEIKPGEHGVTPEDIRKLHSLDDHEAYICSKEIVLTNYEKEIYRKWRDEYFKQNGRYPENDGYFYPKRQFVYLDAVSEDFEDENSNLQYEIYLSTAAEENDCISRLHEIIESMPERWQIVYHRAMLEGYTNVEVAKMLNVTEGRIRVLRRKIEEKIRSDEILKSFLSRGTNSAHFFRLYT